MLPGKYLSSLFNQAILDGDIDSFTEVATNNGPFTYFHKGSLAYLGGWLVNERMVTRVSVGFLGLHCPALFLWVLYDFI